MKLLERAVNAMLLTIASGSPSVPVYAMRAPQNATGPFIIFQRTDSARWRSINNPSGMAQATIQIDCYAASYYQAKELAAAVETLLDGYRGTVYYGSNSPQDYVKIGGITLQNDVDTFDQTEAPLLYRSLNIYLVTYNQED